MTLLYWFYIAAGALGVYEILKYLELIQRWSDCSWVNRIRAVVESVFLGSFLYYGWQLQAYDDLIVNGMMQQGQHFMNILMQLAQMLSQKGLL
jgi:hypothetical protein